MEISELRCRYHPTRLPVVICSQCSNTLCPDCIPRWPKSGYPRCQICRAEMEPLGISQYVKPFWQCFDRFFKFPFLKDNLLFIFITLLFYGIFVPPWHESGQFSVSYAFYRMVIWALFPSFIVGYFSLVAVKATSGAFSTPKISEVWSAGGFSLLFKSLIIISFFYFSLDLIKFSIGPTAEIILSILGALLFPASLILLFMEKEMTTAINPSRIFGLVNAIGWPYAFLWALVMMLVSSSDILNNLPDNIHSSGLYPYIVIMVNLFFGLILFYLLGYVVYQYHHELGLSISHDNIELLNQPKSERKALMIEAELLIAEGNYQSAAKVLQDALKKNSNQERLHEKLLNLSLLTLEQSEQLDAVENYLVYLINSQQNFKAIGIIRKFLKHMPDLTIQHFNRTSEIEEFLQSENEMDLLKQIQKS